MSDSATVSNCDFYKPRPRETLNVFRVIAESEKHCYTCNKTFESGESYWYFIGDAGWGCPLCQDCLEKHCDLEV